MATDAEPLAPGRRPTRGLGLTIAGGIARARDGLARGLIGLGVTPNHITVAGFLLTCGTGYCLAQGAGHQVPYFHNAAAGDGAVSLWPLWAGLFLLASAASDMLDGAVARLGHLGTRRGKFLDSTVDRFSDIAILLGCAIYFGRHGSLTYQVLTYVALANTFLISYIKARAEEVIPDCSVGWWQRGERYVALLLGCFFGHMPVVLWQLSLLAAFTVLRRLTYTWRAATAVEAGRSVPPQYPQRRGLDRLRFWLYPRGTWQFDLTAAMNILAIPIAPWLFPPLLAIGSHADPLRPWLAG
jgi:phosphatidylglycerophosphate synthase